MFLVFMTTVKTKQQHEMTAVQPADDDFQVPVAAKARAPSTESVNVPDANDDDGDVCMA